MGPRYLTTSGSTIERVTNGRVDESKAEVDEVELSEFEATKFRGLAARVNFLAQAQSSSSQPRRFAVTCRLRLLHHGRG